MAHGTGYYWKEQRNAYLQCKTREHSEADPWYDAVFMRLANYYYPDMNDSMEPSAEWYDKYQVTIRAFRETKHGLTADCLSRQFTIHGLDAAQANKLWYNIKNRELSYETVRDMCVTEGYRVAEG